MHCSLGRKSSLKSGGLDGVWIMRIDSPDFLGESDSKLHSIYSTSCDGCRRAYDFLWVLPIVFGGSSEVARKYVCFKKEGDIQVRKWVVLILSTIMLTTTGCGGSKEFSEDEMSESLTKSQKIEVKSVKDSSVVYSTTNQTDIHGFVEKLKLEEWETASIPEKAEAHYEYILHYDSGADDTNRLISYKNTPYIKYTMWKLSFGFQVPDDVADFLNDIDKE